MSYDSCMKLAGAEILDYDSFGSYQGSWMAKVKYDGSIFWVTGYYGSCSGCDPFEAMMSDLYHDGEDGTWHSDSDAYAEHTDCPKCVEAKQKMIGYGKELLTDKMGIDRAIAWLDEKYKDEWCEDVKAELLALKNKLTKEAV